jgi:hypothetical protein
MEFRDMSSLDDRIRALDPFAGVPYEHAAAAAMVERITTAAAPRRHRRGLAVLVAPMTAVAAAGLATGLLVTAGTTAPSLSAIHLAGGVQHAMGTADALGLAVNGAVGSPVVENGYSTAGGEALPSAYAPSPSPTAESANLYFATAPFATAAPVLAAVRVESPASPPSVLAASASTLQMTGVPTRVAPSAWRLGTASDPHGVAGLYRSASGLYDFLYVHVGPADLSARCAQGAASGMVDTDRLAMGSATANLLASIGLRYELAAPTFQTSWSRAGRIGCAGITTLGEQILVQGVPTDQMVRASFDHAGRLVAASFPVFMLGDTASYPLVSPATAASALERSSASFGVLERLAHSDNATNTARTPSARQRVLRDLLIIELRSSSMSLRAFTTTAGGTWLLPVYRLNGDGYTDLAASPVAWSGDVLATASPLVRIVGVAINQARVFDEQRRPVVP